MFTYHNNQPTNDIIIIRHAQSNFNKGWLDYQAINNLDISDENLSAANSRIRDVDMASETADFVKNQILQQAGTSMLAQANQTPNVALKLLTD